MSIVFSQQAEAIRENIGYPEFLTNETALAEMYKGVSLKPSILNPSSFTRGLSFKTFHLCQKIAKVNQKKSNFTVRKCGRNLT